jgi:uncharacterized protein (DUF1800 family)
MTTTRRQLFSDILEADGRSKDLASSKPLKPAVLQKAPTPSLLAAPVPDDSTLGAVDPLVILLNRCTFGFKESEYQRAVSLGYTGWLQEQLNYTAIDASALEAAITTAYPRVTWTAAQLVTEVKSNGGSAGPAVKDLTSATLLRQLQSPRQLYEVMVEFWTNHFNITAASQPENYYKAVDDRDTVRAHALGSFPNMLKASARSLAMQYYLDNVSNTKTGPNENYARELMELHTLGVNGGYTETDVKEVARCFTGWTVVGQSTSTPAFSFVLTKHDTNSKTVLANAIPAGRGIEDGDQVLNILATHPSTAKFIARKLCVRFLGDTPETNVVDAVAATYTSTSGNIASMLLTLFGSAEFMASYDRKIRRPLEFVIGALRVTEPTMTGEFLSRVTTPITTMGQVPFQWPAPNGYPDSLGYWTNTGGMLSRWNWAFGLAEDTITRDSDTSRSIRINIAALIGTANTPTTLVDRLSARLLRRTLATADRDRFISFAAQGGSPTQVLTTTLTLRSRELIGLMLSSPYFLYR